MPSILLPWVRVPSTPSTLFSTYIAQIVCLSFELECEKNENKQKEAGNGPFKKKPEMYSRRIRARGIFRHQIIRISKSKCPTFLMTEN